MIVCLSKVQGCLYRDLRLKIHKFGFGMRNWGQNLEKGKVGMPRIVVGRCSAEPLSKTDSMLQHCNVESLAFSVYQT